MFEYSLAMANTNISSCKIKIDLFSLKILKI